ncbi:protein kinase PKP2 [Ascoidea rubescens DSM 1968]|uniref:Protein-serine/threonine kinase n=1 Tax=Ascoidea rubescens DSM 1968 TaxID=1344418 RepID=A0A1D2VRX3_9ASCO|nr:alpha-ketoacid dehydrogenase kinase [Ascoidea rubescens DSM 1968]ODV64350.1 alpha-ketoacid dehydrogenase kinase [Ascoidea rubescens DSM 1968]
MLLSRRAATAVAANLSLSCCSRHSLLIFSLYSFNDDFSHLNLNKAYIDKIAPYLSNLGPYPPNSKYINKHHFYHNTTLDFWLAKKPHPMTLRQLVYYGKKLNKDKILASANFVREEIPIRIAYKIKELQLKPFSVINNYHLVQVYESYYGIFEQFRKIKTILNLEENEHFCSILQNLLRLNLLNLPHIMMGALECSISQNLSQRDLDDFMSSMLRSRISRRIIAEEHLSLTDKYNFSKDPNYKSKSKSKSKSNDNNNNDNNDNNDNNEFFGDLFVKLSAKENLQYCGELALNFTKSLYPNDYLMPNLIIEGKDIIFQFVPTHLRYLFGEILRNSYEETMINFVNKNLSNFQKNQDFFKQNKPPPITVTIINNKENILFRFSDQGGGLKNNIPIEKIWSFGKNPKFAKQSLMNFHKLPGLDLATNYFDLETNIHSSMNSNLHIQRKKSKVEINQLSSTSIPVESSLVKLIKRPLNFKLGLGLPMCKVYAEYWNGDIKMNCLNNYGTDIYLKLRKLNSLNEKPQLDRA